MTYNDIVKVQQSAGLRVRVVACAAKEGIANPEGWAFEHMWKVATQPGWGEKWASRALNMTEQVRQEGLDIGALDDVITDGDILAAVTSLTTPPEAGGGGGA